MAWLIGDGFDFYNGSGDMTLPGTIWANTSSQGAMSTSTRFTQGLSSSFQAAQFLDSISFTNSTTVFINFSHVCTQAQVAGNVVGMEFILYDASTKQVALVLLEDGSYALTDNSGAIIAGTRSAANSFIQNVWNQIQAKIVIDPSAGSFELRINGDTSPLVTASGLNTRNTSNSYCNKTKINCTSNTVSGNVDDFYMFSDQGAAPTTFQGDVRAVQQMPSSDSSVSWAPNTGALNYNRVNELREDADSSYVLTNTPNNVDQYGIAALSPTPLSIVAVQTKLLARMDDAGPHTVKSRLTSTGTTSDSSDLPLSSTYQWVWQMYAVDPHTSGPWSALNLNAVTIGPFDVL